VDCDSKRLLKNVGTVLAMGRLYAGAVENMAPDCFMGGIYAVSENFPGGNVYSSVSQYCCSNRYDFVEGPVLEQRWHRFVSGIPSDDRSGPSDGMDQCGNGCICVPERGMGNADQRVEAVETIVNSILYPEFYLQFTRMDYAHRRFQRTADFSCAHSGFSYLFHDCTKWYLWHLCGQISAPDGEMRFCLRSGREFVGCSLCAAACFHAGYCEHDYDCKEI